MLRVLLVDDQSAVRSGLRMRLGLEPDLTVVGEAADGETGIALARDLQPDVILMDLRMPGIDGLQAIAELRRTGLKSAIVVLTICDDGLTRLAAQSAGATAFLDKYSLDEQLVAVIRQAAPRKNGAQPPLPLEATGRAQAA